EILFPSASVTIRSAGWSIPLLTPVGVARIRPSSIRMVMLPSLAATQPFSNMRRPTWTISSRCCCSLFGIGKAAYRPILAIYRAKRRLRGLVEDRRQKRPRRLLIKPNRHQCHWFYYTETIRQTPAEQGCIACWDQKPGTAERSGRCDERLE